MNVEKKELASIDKLYAQALITKNKSPWKYLAASEGPGMCVSIDAKTLEKQVVWDEPGGTMTICQLNEEGDFLASQRFLPVFDAKDARLVYGKCVNGTYEIFPCMDLPYIHRFEILTIGESKVFVGATLCEQKDFQQDWSHPGNVYAGIIPEDPTKGWELRPILKSITKNHGFIKTTYNGCDVILVSGSEGLFLLEPPAKPDGEWRTEKLMDREISDMAVVDFDNDGIDEIAVVEGFHGNEVTVNKLVDGKWEVIDSMDIAFGHAMWGGKLLGHNCLFVGYRRDDCKLCLLQQKDGVTEETVIGTGGPSQISVWEDEHSANVLSADREDGKAVLYKITF